MTTCKIDPHMAKPGDKVLPPAREINLWMKRALVEKGLPFSALFLTVIEVIPAAKVDKRGPWTKIRARYSQEFGQGNGINFLVRPTTHLVLGV